MDDPRDDPAAWQRLGQYVTRRRVEIGFRTRDRFAEAEPDIKPRTLGDIETGRRTRYHDSTLAALETALRWRPGSINAVLAGGEPANSIEVLVTHSDDATEQPEDPLLVILRRTDLTEQQKARIVRQVLAEQDQYARRRADELIQDALRAGS